MKNTFVKVKRLATTVMFVVSLVIAQFVGVSFAHATAPTTDTWTGTSGDGKFSTAGNWTSNAVPATGDTLVFNATSLGSGGATVTNDISGLSVAGLTISGTNSHFSSYELTGNPLTITGDITGASNAMTLDLDLLLGANVTMNGGSGIGFENARSIDTQGHNLTVITTSCASLPKLIGSGSIIFNASDASFGLSSGTTSAFTGAISVLAGQAGGSLASLGATSGLTIAGSGSFLPFLTADGQTWNTPISLSGTGHFGPEHSSATGCVGGGSTPGSVYTATFTNVTLGSDFTYNGDDNAVVSGTYTPNSHSFTATGAGTLTLPTGVVTTPTTNDTYADDQSTTDVSVAAHHAAVLDGTRQDVTVQNGGTLSGDGTARNLTTQFGAIVAPGHSPGKLTVLQTLDLVSGSTYQAQLQTVGSYDQLQVSDASRTSGQDVNITDATLDVSLYDGYSIVHGDQFTIIENQQPSTQLVNGTFNGLAEGAQFTVGGITFSITYVGGDGNDVVLTALTTGADPHAPNTAVAFIKANPWTVVALGVATVSVLVGIKIRRSNNR